MSDDLVLLENWASGLLLKLAPTSRRTIAQAISRELRRSQQQRIAAQMGPEGAAFVPRMARKHIRSKKGRIKRDAMFTKLRTAKYLKAKTTADVASVEITGRAGQIASVHQEGGEDRVSAHGPRARYPRRRLLGFAATDRAMIRDVLIDQLSR
ncbi:phage virion morphogenesis protein [Rhodanobacter sp. C03]|uniref:phage virion morphogenesis protein n=1 Tax=Rhodanobacter sp. C03 TaxID=1945858 RepID=UPI0009853C5D|nr:phage virion morphogenesis protein [Rhodanobacter sp. C03]OOG53328.1 phage virion morphogenesis protein [Rhodanobacter sp. C03]